MQRSIERARVELAERLRERRGEIEETLLTRTYAIADPAETADPEYAQGLRAAVSAALEYGLAAVEHGEEGMPSVPVLLLAQARLAARNGVPLDTVLRRYFAGYTLLGDFIVQEAGAGDLNEPWLKRLLRDQAVMFDRFLAAIGEEHTRESGLRQVSSEQRLARRIERLLAGELVDTTGIAYDFNGWHLGILVTGVESERLARDLTAGFDCQLLLLRRDDGVAWGWLSARRQPDPAGLLRAACSQGVADGSVAIGEPGEGLAGWRLTHRQAAAALPIAQRVPGGAVRYADVVLPASILSDDLLAASLHQLFLAPLEGDSDGGATLRQTLQAYLLAGRNVSSAAAALGVKRHTVTNRLRAAEKRIGRSIGSCAAEIDAALRMDQLGHSIWPPGE